MSLSTAAPQVPAGLGIDIGGHPESGDQEGTLQALHLRTLSTGECMIHEESTDIKTAQSSRFFGSALQGEVSGVLGPLSSPRTQGSTIAEIGGATKTCRHHEYNAEETCYKTEDVDAVLDTIPVEGIDGQSAFVRSDTLLSFHVSQTRNAAGLKVLMGNAHSRLKPGAIIESSHQRVKGKKVGAARADAVCLEQAKPRARVEVDIILASNAYVQGDFLQGHIKIRVRKRSKKEAPILLAEGKVRVIGFECIPGEDTRHTFYQCASPLTAIADNLDRLYSSPPDSDGFAPVHEGVHTLPFALKLALNGASGTAKGALNVHSGVAVRYIAMISVKVKDSRNDRRSIAHFYRNCEIWPRLNPSIVLVSAPRPLQANTTKSLSMLNGTSKVKLTALLHRLTWIAGQRCYVNVAVVNDTKKTIKSLSLMLMRTTTVFKPKPALDARLARSLDPDACQTTTMHKIVQDTILEMADQGTKGHASAKGWWTGVGPGQESSFSHFILLPPEALSVTRSRLLEVEYSIRVTISAGSLTPDVHVTLPIRIVNFLSIDPSPSDSCLASFGARVRPLQRRRSIDGEIDSRAIMTHFWSSLDPEGSCNSTLYDQLDSHKDHLGALQRHSRRRNSPRSAPAQPNSKSSIILHVTNPDSRASNISLPRQAIDDDRSVYSSDSNSSLSATHSLASSSSEVGSRALGNLDLDDPDSDEEVGRVVGLARADGDIDNDDASCSAISGPEYGSCASRVSAPRPAGPREGGYLDTERGRRRYRDAHRHLRDVMYGDGARHPDSQTVSRSSFAQRVHEKLSLAAAAAASEATPGRMDNVNANTVSPGSSTNGDGDITPRMSAAQYDAITEIPQVPIQPLRPARHPARHPPVICNDIKPSKPPLEPSVMATSFPSGENSIRASRKLPRPPASIMLSGRSLPMATSNTAAVNFVHSDGCSAHSSGSALCGVPDTSDVMPTSTLNRADHHRPGFVVVDQSPIPSESTLSWPSASGDKLTSAPDRSQSSASAVRGRGSVSMADASAAHFVANLSAGSPVCASFAGPSLPRAAHPGLPPAPASYSHSSSSPERSTADMHRTRSSGASGSSSTRSGVQGRIAELEGRLTPARGIVLALCDRVYGVPSPCCARPIVASFNDIYIFLTSSFQETPDRMSGLR